MSATGHRAWFERPHRTRQARGCGWGGAYAVPRSAGWSARARSALRDLTGGSCLNGAGAARAVSSAAGPAIRASQGTPKGHGIEATPPAAPRLTPATNAGAKSLRTSRASAWESHKPVPHRST
eukprot:Opistho-2@17707